MFYLIFGGVFFIGIVMPLAIGVGMILGLTTSEEPPKQNSEVGK